MKESQWSHEAPSWEDFLAATAYGLDVAGLISMGCPHPMETDWEVDREAKTLRLDLRQQCRNFLGKRFRLARLMARMKQEVLESIIGFKVGHKRVSQIERGRVGLSKENVIKIGNALQLDPNWFRWPLLYYPDKLSDSECRKHKTEIIASAMGAAPLPKTLHCGAPSWAHAYISWVPLRNSISPDGRCELLPLTLPRPERLLDWGLL